MEYSVSDFGRGDFRMYFDRGMTVVPIRGKLVAGILHVSDDDRLYFDPLNGGDQIRLKNSDLTWQGTTPARCIVSPTRGSLVFISYKGQRTYKKLVQTMNLSVCEFTQTGLFRLREPDTSEVQAYLEDTCEYLTPAKAVAVLAKGPATVLLSPRCGALRLEDGRVAVLLDSVVHTIFDDISKLDSEALRSICEEAT